MVDGVRDPQARLRTLEVQFVGEALDTFVAWPSVRLKKFK